MHIGSPGRLHGQAVFPAQWERMGKVMFNKETVCFDFRLIDMGDGTQVIDKSVKTPVDALTPEMQVEYMEVHGQVAFMERMRKKERKEMDRLQREAERKRKLAKNPFYRIACFCGMV